ncbi:MAG: bifunctional DNA-formamidopyrimidine glycosylase/DNA-(apurinic or apyrimidinic site) lyase [Lentisphaerae bacterium]|jgi:formamidopyrimidine-DNA glycosylase|nr:bifunctional DNA-formamidopyrimidine glycosylase/DNA-(apurinic or apyrimidinic site) lyase [Lentisphaerota bacterium]
MPELPEVETIIRELRAARVIGSRITQARVLWPKTVAEPGPRAFSRQLAGREILDISRRAKYIIITVSDGQTLLIHLRMTGHLNILPPQTPPRRHDRLVLILNSRQQIHFADARKFGRAWLTRTPERYLAHLGPEPLTLITADFLHRLAGRSRQLKPLLLDQAFIAGLGNIYTDEALWIARLHPCRRADTLSPAQAGALLRAIKQALRRGIRNLGTTLGDGKTNFVLPRGERGRNQEQLNAYGQTGAPCPRCKTPIQRILVAQRATHLCPLCQTLP